MAIRKDSLGSYSSTRTTTYSDEPGVYTDTKTGETVVYTERAPDIIRTTRDPATGWRPPTDWSHNTHRHSIHPGSNSYSEYDPWRWRWRYVTETGYKPGILVNNLNDLSFDYAGGGIQDTDNHRKAVTECLLKLSDGKANLGQFMAESKQAAEMLASAGTNMGRLLLNLKRGQIQRLPQNLRSLKRTYKGIAGTWLQWQYGWKPLASDLYLIQQDLTGKLEKPGQFLHARRQCNDSWNFEKKDQLGMIPSPAKVQVKHVDRCQLTARLANGFSHEATRYGLTNPISLTWELVPFSFVFDWFMPIGNVMQALTASVGLEFVGGFHSQSQKGTIEIPGEIGSATRNLDYFTRSKYNDFPRPLPYAVKNPISPTRGANLLAILAQLIK